MKKLFVFTTLVLAFMAFGASQCLYSLSPPAYHPAPSYHAPAYHAPAARAPAYHAPRQSAPRTPAYHAPRQSTPHQSAPHNNSHAAHSNNNHNNANHNNANRNADRAHRDTVKHENRARHDRNKAFRNEHRAAHREFRNGRFSDRYYGAHFGRAHAIVFGGPRFWVGTPYGSPFWWGGVQWGFGPGIFWPGLWGLGEGCYIEYVPGVGYVMVNPAFPDTTLALTANIDAEPVDELDAQ
jgi:hypothetical protein